MPRTEIEIMTGWRFALGESKPELEQFREVCLPHDWAIDMPINADMQQGMEQGFRDRWSIGRYIRTLTLSEKKAGYCYYLDFGGIYENSIIYINGKEAGRQLYGYTSFLLDITPFINSGDNEILVKVDNTAFPADRWYSGCGIYRTVKFIEVEEKHFDRREICVTTEIFERRAVLTVHTGVDGAVEATLSYDGETVAKGESNLSNTIVLEVSSPRLWSADEPSLYTLELKMAGDAVTLPVGIREVKFIGEGSGIRAGMYVNGKRETLKGVCVHQDVGCRGTAAKKEIWRQRLSVLKEMGCNFIRAAHHPFSSEFLELCDELGFYVYDESFDKWAFGAYERYFDTQWQSDLEAMVKRDRNHACVIIWGVGNEETNQGQSSMLGRLKMLCDYVRSIDSTRPVTYAMKPHFKRDGGEDEDLTVVPYSERIRYAAEIGKIVDIICCNYMDQWYEQLHEYLPDKLIIGTEVYQYFAGAADNMQNFDENIPSLVPERLDYCIGSAIWTGIDYLGESFWFPYKGRSNSPVRTNCTRRPMFYVLQSYWTKEPMVHFSVLDYSAPDEGTKWHWSTPPFADHWHFPQYSGMVMIPYIIASSCDEVRLFLNGNEYLVPKPSECKNRIIKGYLPYIAGTVKAVGYKDGREVCSHVTVTPKQAVRLEFENSEYTVPFEEGYELLLTVRAVDENGVQVFRDSIEVEFEAEGGAQVIAVDNADFTHDEPYSSNRISMRQGMASVQIRLNGQDGECFVKAWAKGLREAVQILTRLK